VTFVPYDRPVRAAFIGLGRIYDLNVRAYAGNPDVEVVALVDPSEERLGWQAKRWLHTGDGPLSFSGEEAVDVLRFALAAYASSASGGAGVNPGQLR
jgi:predicted dehydrogenase